MTFVIERVKLAELLLYWLKSLSVSYYKQVDYYYGEGNWTRQECLEPSH